jgi:uncharacterized protein GlcG (DUF336 family)
MSLTLAEASVIVDKALEKGRELGFKPLTVAVLDAGGHLAALKREDGSSLLRPEIAGGKAWGALGMGFGGREFPPPRRGQPRLHSGAERRFGRAHRAGTGRRADPRQRRGDRRRRWDQRRHFGQ